jgi:2-succinyl-6-hydroxy-2,4-cyclohexadiene-1-carboxylate synthase
VSDADLLSPAAAMTMRTTVPELSVAADIGRIAVPTLLVNGVRETAFQPLRDRAVREVPGLAVADLDGGHSVNLDCADGFNTAVAAFIALHGGDACP